MYISNISILHSAGDAAGSATWAMRVPVASTKRVFIRKIGLNLAAQATTTVANVAYEAIRFSGGDPTTGTTVPRIKKRSIYGASAILDANIQQKDGILTITGASFDPGPFCVMAMRVAFDTAGSTAPIAISRTLEFSEQGGRGVFTLEPGEGIALRVHRVAAISGLHVTGYVSWDEDDI